MTRITVRHTGLAGMLVVGAVLLAGCSDGADRGLGGGSTVATSGSGGDRQAYNNADVTFAQGLVPQQHGALTLAQLAPDRTGDPRIVHLASRIEAAQQSQVDALNGWLQEWGEPLPEERRVGDHGPADLFGGMAMGRLPDEEVTIVSATTGAEFDRRFLALMVEQYRAMVELAEAEIAAGSYPDAVALARRIVDVQTAEIQEMESLLADFSP